MKVARRLHAIRRSSSGRCKRLLPALLAGSMGGRVGKSYSQKWQRRTVMVLNWPFMRPPRRHADCWWPGPSIAWHSRLPLLLLFLERPLSLQPSSPGGLTDKVRTFVFYEACFPCLVLRMQKSKYTEGDSQRKKKTGQKERKEEQRASELRRKAERRWAHCRRWAILAVPALYLPIC